MFNPQIFRANLRAARKKCKLSQKDLAEKLYISTQAVSKWERGIAVPGLEHICCLSKILHTSVDDLLGTGKDREASLIAVDGGGTKTEFVLISLSGKLIKRLVLPGSNPNTCTIKGTVEILQNGIDTLLQEDNQVLGIYVGGAGFYSSGNGAAIEELLRKHYSGIPVQCESDIMNVFAFAADPDNAIAVISGTGAVVYATRKGALLRCGGGGWRLELLGSGYDLGRAALLAAMEDRDGTGPKTMITQLAEEKLGGCVWDSIQKIYGENTSYIASFAPLVIQAWQAGDALATKIAEENCNRLAQLIRIATEKSPDATEVILGGSLLTQCTPFRELLTGQLSKKLHPYILEQPQIWGACLRCAALAKVPAPDVQNFMIQYIQED